MAFKIASGKPAEILIKEKSPNITVNNVIKWFSQLCDALEYCHTVAKIVHSDISDGNVIIDTRTNKVALLDFGLAKVIENSNSQKITLSTEWFGTERYAGPVDTKSFADRSYGYDLFSLGVLLCDFLNFKIPEKLGKKPEIFSNLDNLKTHVKVEFPFIVDDRIIRSLYLLLFDMFNSENPPDGIPVKVASARLNNILKLMSEDQRDTPLHVKSS